MNSKKLLIPIAVFTACMFAGDAFATAAGFENQRCLSDRCRL
jgi:hypothetical protein